MNLINNLYLTHHIFILYQHTFMRKNINLMLLVITVLSHTYAQVGLGTNTPDASAIIELHSTEKGFLPPRLSTAQRDAMSSHAEGLVIYNLNNKCLEFFNGLDWISACDGSVVTSAPAVTTVTSTTGKVWMDRNLGAGQVATSSTDEDSYGDLYQWGRAADGHQLRTSPNYTDEITGDGVANFNASGNAWDGQFILRNSGANNWVSPSVTDVNNLWQGVNGINNPCPAGYRIPTKAELDAERQSWSSNNAVGAFASPLKLPAAGYRFSNNGNLATGIGLYWSSTLITTVTGDEAHRLLFSGSSTNTQNSPLASGFSVRCIKD
jgi:uncharacterized protein (TIGR02145 family)